MDFALYDDSLNMASYGMHIEALDASFSGSSAASSPHISSPSPQYLDFDFSFPLVYPYVPYSALASSLGSQVDQGTMCIAPEALHAPTFFQVAVSLESDALPLGSIPGHGATSAPLDAENTAESLEEYAVVSPDAYPMKKDRQRGNANLLRSVCVLRLAILGTALTGFYSHQAKDPERQHACTVCIRKFKRRADLARHLKRHQGIRQYNCPAKCCPLAPADRFFFRADARQRHWKANPECEVEFYSTGAGLDWYAIGSLLLLLAKQLEAHRILSRLKKNKNRSQKLRSHRRQTNSSRGSSLEINHDCYDDDEDDDAEYHD